MTCVTLVKAVLARIIFALHILITVWRVVEQPQVRFFINNWEFYMKITFLSVRVMQVK